METTALLSIIGMAISAAKVALEIGVAVLPQAKNLLNNAYTLITAFINGEEISDDELANLRKQTDELNELCAKYEKENFGIE